MLLVIKIFLFIVSIFTLLMAKIEVKKEKYKRTPKSNIYFLISIICMIILGILLKKSVYLIPKLMVIITVYFMAIVFLIDGNFTNKQVVIIFIAFLLNLIMFFVCLKNAYNIDHSIWNEETQTTRYSICEDAYTVDGKVCSVLYIKDLYSNKSEYEFMYKTEEGEVIKMNFPSDNIEIVYGKEGYYEEITKIRYPKNKTKEYFWAEKSEMYKLSIPDDIIFISSYFYEAYD